MAAEYIAVNQLVQPNAGVLFSDGPKRCNLGLIFHNGLSSLFRLASPSALGVSCRRPCCCKGFPEANYQVSFRGNIAVPGDPAGTVEEITLAITVDGEAEAIPMRFTPAAVDEYGNVSTDIIVSVPCVCRCSSLSIRNTSTQPINVEGILTFDFAGIS